jgi:hypothetical protein
MMKLVVVFFVGVALAVSHAASRGRTQEVAAKANALIDDARAPAKIMLDPSSKRQMVIDTCRVADPTVFKLLAFDYGELAEGRDGGAETRRDMADIGVLERQSIPFKCEHVPFDEFWQDECARDCRTEWSWLSDDLGRIRVHAGTQGVLMVAL